MTINDLELLRSVALRDAVEHNLERDPASIALDGSVPCASLVATQVKYLQRAKRKLPMLYDARCIIPPRAFEQSSSEECAERKPIEGDSVLDLTCGLGIDAIALSRRFRRVVALERDAVLAEVVRYNLSLLGITNIEVVNTSAEEYVATCNEHFDWVYVDPDRRSDVGRKLVCLEDCSPDMVALMPGVRRIAGRVAMKLSPMFDCDEAFRLFPESEVEVVSLGGECKELNILTDAPRAALRIAIIGQGEWLFDRTAMMASPYRGSFADGEWRYMVMPDVALHKARVAVAALMPHAAIWSNNGYGFMCELPEKPLPGRVYAIEAVERYHPKELKRSLRGVGVEISKRDTKLTVEAVRRALGVKAGSDKHIALTTIDNENWVIHLKTLSL